MTDTITFSMVEGLLPSPDLVATCSCGWRFSAWDDDAVRGRAALHLEDVHMSRDVDRFAMLLATVDARRQ